MISSMSPYYHFIIPTVHWVHGLECHYFRCLGVWALQQSLQVSAVIVAEDETLSSAVPDAHNHRRMVPCIRVYLAPCVPQWTQSETRGDDFPHTGSFFLQCMKRETRLRGQDSPGSILAKVKRVESFATKQEEKANAESFWCSWASSFSKDTWKLLVPEMFLVPPAPAPCLSTASLTTSRMKWNIFSWHDLEPCIKRVLYSERQWAYVTCTISMQMGQMGQMVCFSPELRNQMRLKFQHSGLVTYDFIN